MANGFGPMYFNLRDPSFTQQNVPVKLENETHTGIIIVTVIFLGGLIGGIIMITTDVNLIGGAIGLIVVPYIIYLCVVGCCNNIMNYLENVKKFDDYQPTYDKMVNGRGSFKFWI